MDRSISNKNRSLTIALIIVLAVVIWLASTAEVNAAAKKTFNVVTKTVTEYEAADEDDPGSDKCEFKYYSNGLLKSATDIMNMSGFSGINSDWETVYKYDKNGLKKSEVATYKGDKANKTVYTIKKGKITASKYYDTSSGNELLSTDKYYYKKGKLSKIVTTHKEDGSKSTMTYHSNGKPKKYTSNFISNQTWKFDKYGNPTYVKTSYEDGDGTTSTYTNTYDKKGRIKKIVENDSIIYDGRSYKETATTTFKYTTKSGKVTKVVQTVRTVSNFSGTDTEQTSVTTTKYSYKKIKVAKKFWKIVEKQQDSIL